MAKRKMIQYNLLKNSIASYYAAIEIHNKPNIAFRYETTTLLLVCAWELLLKAFIRKYIKQNLIFEIDKKTNEKKTISYKKAITYVSERLNKDKPKSFVSIEENLRMIEEYRNSITHFYCEKIEPFIFMLIAKCALNYVDFIKTHFSKDIITEEGFFILPLGFKLPFNPQDYLSNKSASYQNSEEVKKFIDNIITTTKHLDKKGIEDSIVLGFDIFLENVKKVSNSDLLVAITSMDEANTTFAKTVKYQIVNDPSAQKIVLSEDDINSNFPYDYKKICDICRKEISNYKQNNEFNKIMRKLKGNQTLCYTRKLDPRNKKTSTKTFYSKSVIDVIKKEYEEKGVNHAKHL